MTDSCPTEQLASAVRRLQIEGKSRRSVPAEPEAMDDFIQEAHDAAYQARLFREYWRRRGSVANPDRLAGLEAHLKRLKAAAAPLKIEQGRFPRDARRARRWGTRCRKAAEAVQEQRRALWRMQNRAKGRA